MEEIVNKQALPERLQRLLELHCALPEHLQKRLEQEVIACIVKCL